MQSILYDISQPTSVILAMEKADNEVLFQQLKTIWIFGYGSLLWNPDFEYLSKKKGYIRGYVRRFWQENTTQRGTPEKPGRVATLVEESEGTVWGEAYEVKGGENIRKALGNLTTRETKLGGYITVVSDFYPNPENGITESRNYKVLLYMATPENPLYKKTLDMQALAKQIVVAKGFKGSNVEYVVKLADYVKKHIPEDNDSHLFELEKCVKAELLQNEAHKDDEVGQNTIVSPIAV